MRFRAKVDVVQGGLVELYRAHGCSWWSTASLGAGAPDGVVGLGGITDPVEFKAEKAKLMPHQQAWHEAWRGSPVRVIREREDVIQHVESLRRRARVLRGVA